MAELAGELDSRLARLKLPDFRADHGSGVDERDIQKQSSFLSRSRRDWMRDSGARVMMLGPDDVDDNSKTKELLKNMCMSYTLLSPLNIDGQCSSTHTDSDSTDASDSTARPSSARVGAKRRRPSMEDTPVKRLKSSYSESGQDTPTRADRMMLLANVRRSPRLATSDTETPSNLTEAEQHAHRARSLQAEATALKRAADGMKKESKPKVVMIAQYIQAGLKYMEAANSMQMQLAAEQSARKHTRGLTTRTKGLFNDTANFFETCASLCNEHKEYAFGAVCYKCKAVCHSRTFALLRNNLRHVREGFLDDLAHPDRAKPKTTLQTRKSFLEDINHVFAGHEAFQKSNASEKVCGKTLPALDNYTTVAVGDAIAYANEALKILQDQSSS